MVYLPMCYLYGKRFMPDVASDPVLLALRKELYPEEYDKIVWVKYICWCRQILNVVFR